MWSKLGVFLLISLVISVIISSGKSDAIVASDDGFGYEILQFRLDQLQNSQNQMSDKIAQDKDLTRIAFEKHNLLLEQILNEIKTISNNTNCKTAHKNHSYDICKTAESSGLFKIVCDDCPTAVTAYCEMESFGGEWLVVQQRIDGSVDFSRSWAEYRDGFGTPGKSTEFWLGLEMVHRITHSGNYEMVIELRDENKKYGYARYADFKIAGEEAKFRLSHLGDYNGTIPNHFKHHKDKCFTTFDNDNDEWPDNCAVDHSGGWWHKNCYWVNLNGKYTGNNAGLGIYWSSWSSKATFSRIMIRRK